MPQLRFNEDGQWHDFAPEGGTGLKAGPWFPYLYLEGDDRLSDHRVNRPRPVKGAGMNKSLAPSTAPAFGSAGAHLSSSSKRKVLRTAVLFVAVLGQEDGPKLPLRGALLRGPARSRG